MNDAPIPPQDLIRCPECNHELIFIRGGNKEKKEFWEAYYRCQSKCIERFSNGSYRMFKILARDAEKNLKKMDYKKLLNQLSPKL